VTQTETIVLKRRQREHDDPNHMWKPAALTAQAAAAIVPFMVRRTPGNALALSGAPS
jgi:hypothetical protein